MTTSRKRRAAKALAGFAAAAMAATMLTACGGSSPNQADSPFAGLDRGGSTELYRPDGLSPPSPGDDGTLIDQPITVTPPEDTTETMPGATPEEFVTDVRGEIPQLATLSEHDVLQLGQAAAAEFEDGASLVDIANWLIQNMGMAPEHGLLFGAYAVHVFAPESFPQVIAELEALHPDWGTGVEIDQPAPGTTPEQFVAEVRAEVPQLATWSEHEVLQLGQAVAAEFQAGPSLVEIADWLWLNLGLTPEHALVFSAAAVYVFAPESWPQAVAELEALDPAPSGADVYQS